MTKHVFDKVNVINIRVILTGKATLMEKEEYGLQ